MAKSYEQLYIFIDLSGNCFECFQGMGDNICTQKYNELVVRMFRAGKKFSVGDMLAFRDDLLNAGFEWGKDFCVNKV